MCNILFGFDWNLSYQCTFKLRKTSGNQLMREEQLFLLQVKFENQNFITFEEKRVIPGFCIALILHFTSNLTTFNHTILLKLHYKMFSNLFYRKIKV